MEWDELPKQRCAERLAPRSTKGVWSHAHEILMWNLWLIGDDSALVHLEADAEMQKYEVEGEDVSKRSLNLVQRMRVLSLSQMPY